MTRNLFNLISRITLVAIFFQVFATALIFSPKQAFAAIAGDVVINEIMINKSGSGSGQWIELYYTGNTSRDVTGWKLFDNRETSTIGIILDNTVLNSSNRFLAINVSGLNYASNDSVVLKNESNEIESRKDYTALDVPSILGNTLSLIPDGSSDWMNVRATKDAPNNSILPEPQLIYPQDKSYINTKDVNFTWNTVIDPEGDTLAYDLTYGPEGQSQTTVICSNASCNINFASDGKYIWNVLVKDGFGARTLSQTYSFTIDTLAPPVITIDKITGSATLDGTATIDWSAYSDPDAEKYYIYDSTDKKLAEVTDKKWITNTITDFTIYKISVIDQAGNESEKTSITVERGKVFFNETPPPGEVPVITPVAGNLKVGVLTDDPNYGIVTKPENPAHLLTDDLKKKAVGSYWTFEYNGDNNGGIIQIYFTQAELDASHITDPGNQLILYYYNNSQWEPYGSSEYISPSDLNGFIGYLKTTVGHFSEFVAVADKFVPTAPTNVKLSHYDSKLKILWDRVEGAIGYKVYIGTSVSNMNLAEEVADGNITQIEKSVESGKTYFVKIFALGYDSLLSPASEIISLAIAGVEPQVVFATVEPTEEIVPSPVVSESILQPPIEPPISSTPTLEEEKSDEEESSTNRIVISIIILILAAGAGIGGYYGYLWWQDRNQPEEKAPVSPAKKTTPVKSKTKKSASTKRRSSRW